MRWRCSRVSNAMRPSQCLQIKEAVVLEVTRPALRLLRKLPTFGNILDETYRAHGIGRVLEDLTSITGKPLSEPLAEELRRTARYMVYGKNHVLCKEGEPIDRLILIKSGWVRRSHGVPFHAASPEVVLGMDETIGVDFLGGGNCLGLEGVTQPETWKYRASLMARTEVLEIPLDQFSADPGFARTTGRDLFIAFNCRECFAARRSRRFPI